MIIDFKYVQEMQKSFCKHLENKKGIKYQEESFNVPMWLILAIHSEVGEVLNASKVHKIWDKSEIDRNHLLEELADLLSHIANLANFLEVDLVLDIQEVQITAVETTFNRLFYRTTTLDWNKRQARYTLTRYILPLFVELLYSFGFSLDDLEEAYKAKLKINYERF